MLYDEDVYRDLERRLVDAVEELIQAQRQVDSLQEQLATTKAVAYAALGLNEGDPLPTPAPVADDAYDALIDVFGAEGLPEEALPIVVGEDDTGWVL